MAKPLKESRIPQLRGVSGSSSQISLANTLPFQPSTSLHRPQTFSNIRKPFLQQTTNLANQPPVFTKINGIKLPYHHLPSDVTRNIQHEPDETLHSTTLTGEFAERAFLKSPRPSRPNEESHFFDPVCNSTVVSVAAAENADTFYTSYTKTPPDSNKSHEYSDSSLSDCNVTIVRNTSQNAGSSFKCQKATSSADSALAVTHLNHGDGNCAERKVNSPKEDHIGHQVIVGGTEVGILKYVGPVQFEQGLWCGVELSNPVGKHNGIVKGTRYFTCRNNHGIIAPISKVDIITEAKSNFERLKSKFENCTLKLGISSCKYIKKFPSSGKLEKRLNVNETIILGEDEGNSSPSGPFSLIGITSPGCAKTFVQHDTFVKPLTAEYRIQTPENNIETDTKDLSYTITKNSPSLNERVRPVLNRRLTHTIEPTYTSTDITCTFTKTDEVYLKDKSLNCQSKILNTITNANSSLTEDIECTKRHNTCEINCHQTYDILNDNDLCKSCILSADSPVDSPENTSAKINKDLTEQEDSRKKSKSILLKSQTSSEEEFAPLKTSSPDNVTGVTPPLGNLVHNLTTFRGIQLKRHLPVSPLVIDPFNPKATSPGEGPGHTVTTPMSIRSLHLKSVYEQQQSASTPGSALLHTQSAAKPALTLTSSSLPNSTFVSPQTNTKSPIFAGPNCLHLSKQNSFEFDESLGILTPDQMCEFPKTPSNDDLRSLLLDSRTSDKTLSKSRTPSSENIGSLSGQTLDNISDRAPPPVETTENLDVTFIERSGTVAESETYESFITRAFKQSSDVVELPSPTVPESFAGDISLEILNEDILNNISFLADNSISNLDTTINMDLPLDPFDGYPKGISLKQLRCEQTPSPEDLPLDPVGVKTDMIESVSNNGNTDSDPKSKSITKTSSSFIMSITSITSLDNGYQGDGEMSRPASRGGDHSPTVHKPSNQGLVVAINNQWQRAVNRRPDPMTDSDFFTESDADGHDENAPKGDRRAQVIDGHLYGLNAPNPQPTGEEIFVNNQNQVGEEMDSSGIFTDLDTNTRADELSDAERNRNTLHPANLEEDQSPSDVSSKTISENSQERLNDLNETLHISQMENVSLNSSVQDADESKKSKSLPESGQSSPSGLSSNSPKHAKAKANISPKQYKMPRRNVVSKVKTMLDALPSSRTIENQENRKPSPKKTGNKWDAVMSKILDSKSPKPNLREVKSKVATGLTSATNETRSSALPKRLPTVFGTTSNNANKTATAATKLKRRTRSRNLEGASKSGSGLSKQASGSIHSSLSDISNSGSVPARLSSKTNSLQSLSRSTKKGTVTRCTSPPSVETPSSRSAHQPVSVSAGGHRITRAPSTLKKSPPQSAPASVDTPSVASQRRTVTRRFAYGGAGAKTSPSAHANANATKDPSRVTGAGVAKSRTPVTVPTALQQGLLNPPIIQPPPALLAPIIAPHLHHAAIGVEALGVLLQHLVFQYDAFKTPYLKRDLEKLRKDWTKTKLELDETRMGYRRLEELLNEEKRNNDNLLTTERLKYQTEVDQLTKEHRLILLELNEKHAADKNQAQQRFNAHLEQHQATLEHKLTALKSQYDTLNVDYESVKRECMELKTELHITRNTFMATESDYKLKLDKANHKLNSLKQEFRLKENELTEKLTDTEKRATAMEEDARKVVESFKAETKDSRLQAALSRCTQLQDETESLRCVLGLKQTELAELRKSHAEASSDAEQLPSALLRAQTLQARVEDLELQLERKTNFEKQLAQEKKLWMESFQQESEQKKRLSFQNEELQWKLKQNHEVVNVLLSGIHTPSKISLHGSNQSLNDDNLVKSPRTPLTRSLQTSSFSEKHSFGNNPLERNSSFRERLIAAKGTFRQERKSSSDTKKSEESMDSSFLLCFEPDDISPPSSPKIKAVVEKSDSVSYVLEMDESPEVLANRMYRRSFRNSTPPKTTPTKSPAPKRYKCKSNHPLSLSASETSIGSDSRDGDSRSRSKSVSIKNHRQSEKARSDNDDCFSNSWDSSVSPTNRLLDFRQEVRRVELGPSEIELESMAGDLIIGSDSKHNDHDDVENDYTDHSIHMSLPALPSELNRSQKHDKKQDLLPSLPSSGDMRLLQAAFPKISGGEAMISESNSEDECSTSVSSERSHSLSDVEHHEDLAKTAADICEKTSKMQYDLMLMTESTNSENMDCSWSEDI